MSQDFTSGSIPGKMANFMLPILGALILQAMYSADSICHHAVRAK